MSRCSVPLFWVAIGFFGCAGVAHADTECMGAFGNGLEQCSITGTLNAQGQGQFTVPQFDPAMGKLQSFSLSTVVPIQLSGTISLSYYCGGAIHCNFGYYGAPFLSVSAGSPDSFTIAADCPAPGPMCISGITGSGGVPGYETATLGWSTGASGGLFYGPSFSGPTLLSDPGSLIGTGNLTFNMVENPDLFPAPGTTETGLTINPSPYDLVLVYAFAPAAVPEPSLLVVNALLFGSLLIVRRRCWRRPSKVR